MAWQMAPALFSLSTIAPPIPLPPPVTTATLPTSDSRTQENLHVVSCGSHSIATLPYRPSRSREVSNHDGVAGGLPLQPVTSSDVRSCGLPVHSTPPREPARRQ